MLDTLIILFILVFIILFSTVTKRISGGGIVTTIEYKLEVKTPLSLYRSLHLHAHPDLAHNDLPQYRPRGPRRRNN
jgi:hypothetical protein